MWVRRRMQVEKGDVGERGNVGGEGGGVIKLTYIVSCCYGCLFTKRYMYAVLKITEGIASIFL